MRRGFHPGYPMIQDRLEQIGAAFLHGYHAALLDDMPETLVPRLSEVQEEWRGFAFEGAGMGLELLDQLMPWRQRRLDAFLAGPGAAYSYLVHVGVGWTLALLHRRIERPLARLDRLLRWLAVDGYGFYQGYFHWPRAVASQRIPKHLMGYARRAFDQGLGRSLWFVDGADVRRIPMTIAAFPPARQADLWSGVGLACAYAGGVERAALAFLRDAAGAYLPHLAQGAAFAAKAREHAGNPTDHTALACIVLCGRSAAAAAHVTDIALADLSSEGVQPAYEEWRRRIQMHLAQELIWAG